MSDKTAADLLAEIKTLHREGERNHRDALIVVGRKLHEFILVYLKEADGLSEYARNKRKINRRQAVRMAANELEVGQQRINYFIEAAMTADLLGSEGLGTIGLRSLIHFCKLCRRKRGGRGDQEVGAVNGPTPAQTEEWEIHPDYAIVAPELFRRAVLESWGQIRVGKEIAKFYKGGPHSKQQNRKRRASFYPADPLVDNLSARERIVREASVGQVGDVAEMILDIIRASPEAQAVAERLLPELQRLKSEKRPRKHSFAGD